MAQLDGLRRLIAGIVLVSGLGHTAAAQQNSDAVARQFVELSWLSVVAKKCVWTGPAALAGLDMQLGVVYAELTAGANPDGKVRFDAAIADAKKRGEAADCAAVAGTRAQGFKVIQEQAAIALIFASRMLEKVPAPLADVSAGDATEVIRLMLGLPTSVTTGPMKPVAEATRARADLAAALICHPDLFRLSPELTEKCGKAPPEKLPATPVAKEALKHVAAYAKMRGATAREQRAKVIESVGSLNGIYGFTHLYRDCAAGMLAVNLGTAMRRKLDPFEPLMLADMQDLGRNKPPEPVLFVIKSSRREPGFGDSMELQIISFDPGELHLVTSAVTGTHIAKPGAKPSSGIVARSVADQLYKTYAGKALADSINGTAKKWRVLRCPHET